MVCGFAPLSANQALANALPATASGRRVFCCRAYIPIDSQARTLNAACVNDIIIVLEMELSFKRVGHEGG